MSLSHLSDGTLRQELDSLVATDCRTTAKLLSRIAEFDRRRLYAEDGYSSMFVFCVRKLHFSEDMAFKRIRVARAARRCPALLEAIADGRLHLTGAVFLAPHLKPENSKELIECAAHKTKAEIELLIAQRSPRPDLASRVRAIPAPAPTITRVPEVVPEPVADPKRPEQGPPMRKSEVVPQPPRTSLSAARVTPLAPRRFAFQTTIGQTTNDKVQAIQELLGPRVHPRDLEQILDRAFDALLEKLQRAKCGAADRPRQSPAKPSKNPRHVPAHVKRAVWSRVAADARSSATQDSDARNESLWSTTTSSRLHVVVEPPWTTFACSAARTISSAPNEPLDPSSCAEGAKLPWRRGGPVLKAPASPPACARRRSGSSSPSGPRARAAAPRTFATRRRAP